MKKFIVLFLILMCCNLLFSADENAKRDGYYHPTTIQESKTTGEIRRIKCREDGIQLFEVIGGTITSNNYNDTQTQTYINKKVLTAPFTAVVHGIGISWLVRVKGGNCEFKLNGGDSVLLYDGEGIGDEFNFVNPAINITSLTPGATAQIYMRYR